MPEYDPRWVLIDPPTPPETGAGDLQGTVIGIDRAIQSPIEGSVEGGFAIPINRARSLLP